MPNVLPDANVLYSRTLLGWICLLATRSGLPLFHLRWTEDILAEVVYPLRKNHPHYSDRQIGGVRDKIVDIVAEDGRISGYDIDPELGYTDECDAHLHAAAEHGDVQYVITNDGGFHHFAAANDELLGYEVYTPDDFLMLIHRDAIATVREVLLDQICYHGRRGKPFNLAASLESAQAPMFAAAIREMMQAPAVAHALSRVSG